MHDVIDAQRHLLESNVPRLKKGVLLALYIWGIFHVGLREMFLGVGNPGVTLRSYNCVTDRRPCGICVRRLFLFNTKLCALSLS